MPPYLAVLQEQATSPSDKSETDEVMMSSWSQADGGLQIHKWGMATNSTEGTILKNNCHGVDDLKLYSTSAKEDVHYYTGLL